MKLKSFVTATLALGLLSTVGAALPSHEASADSNNGYKELTMDGKHTVPYTISVDGITAFTLNDGNKKVVNLKKNDDAKNSIDPSTIKQIQIVVK
ncbi:MAP domain-containing protein [Staphylococcus aureus]|nr:MAP domain-containing protein [Staphylococcus aureus]